MDQTRIFAHRGASRRFAENTLPAFEAALEAGADGFELDVQLSKDGVLVVTHDESVDRVSNGRGLVKDLTYRTLSQLNMAHFRPELEATQIPILEDVLKLIVGTDKICNIELKDSVYAYEGMREKCVELVHRLGVEKQIIYSSFHHGSIESLHKLDPNAKTALLYNNLIRAPWDYAKSKRAAYLHPDHKLLSLPGYISRCHVAGVGVNAWTVNDPFRIKTLIRRQVDGIITDVPEIAVPIRDQLRP